jgi:hypothetical protein
MTKLSIALQIASLIASGSYDAYTSNRLLRQARAIPGYHATEVNPLLKPFSGKPTMYLVIPIGDLAIYGSLRLAHKPRAAKAYLIGSVSLHLGIGSNNLAQAVSISRKEPK